MSMKREKAKKFKKLKYHEFYLHSQKDVLRLELLLERMVGNAYEAGRHRSKKEWRVSVWLTRKEMKLVEELLFEIPTPDWDREYELLLEAGD